MPPDPLDDGPEAFALSPPWYDPEPWCSREGHRLVGLREAAALLGMRQRVAGELLESEGIRTRWTRGGLPYYDRRRVLDLADRLRTEA